MTLSAKEARRVYVMEQVALGNLTASQAATVLGLSVRHVRRLKGEMEKHGVASLAHKNRGREPSNKIPEPIRQQIVELATGLCKGASCQHLAEILASADPPVHVSAKSIARILKAAKIPIAHTHKSARGRRSRTRMPQEGLLVQIDSSPFAWLEARGPWMSLHGAIDDATGKILGLYFRPTEDLHGYFQVLWQVIVNHGVPQSIYSDRHTILISPKESKLSIEEELAGIQRPLTQFGQALNELGVSHIRAYSPQAKGRVERLWRTLQHRLLIELRLAAIDSIDKANAFLPGFIQRFNERFAVEPASAQKAYRPSPPISELTAILAVRQLRKTDSGSTISYKSRRYQLVNGNGAIQSLPARKLVTVLECFDGQLRARCDGVLYALQQCNAATPKQKPLHLSKRGDDTPHIPQPDHPWRQSYKTIHQRYVDYKTSLRGDRIAVPMNAIRGDKIAVP